MSKNENEVRGLWIWGTLPACPPIGIATGAFTTSCFFSLRRSITDLPVVILYVSVGQTSWVSLHLCSATEHGLRGIDEECFYPSLSLNFHSILFPVFLLLLPQIKKCVCFHKSILKILEEFINFFVQI